MAIPIACRCGGVKRDGKCDRCGAGPRQKHAKTTNQRGYDGRWKRLSEAIRKDEPLCVRCFASGKYTACVACHHIVKVKDDRSLRLERDNSLPVCSGCHDYLDESYERDKRTYWAEIKELNRTRENMQAMRENQTPTGGIDIVAQ